MPDPVTNAARFDRYVIVDWSAAARPVTGANSIWIADFLRGASEVALHNPSTRAAALQLIAATVAEPAERVFVGVDVSFGLPDGAIAAWCGEGANWLALWERVASEVDDADSNHNDRFAAAARLNRALSSGVDGPFWGHPPTQHHAGLSATRGEFPPPIPLPAESHRVTGDAQPLHLSALAEYRVAERRLRELGHQVQSTWKIAYQASVGGQFLTAVGRLLELRARCPHLRVWPFDAGAHSAGPPGAGSWIAEVWPGEFALGDHHPIRDADQVVSTVRAFADADDRGELDSWLALPADQGERRLAMSEGWPVSPALAGRGARRG